MLYTNMKIIKAVDEPEVNNYWEYLIYEVTGTIYSIIVNNLETGKNHF